MTIAFVTCAPADRDIARKLVEGLNAEDLRAELLDDLDDERVLAGGERRCLVVLVSPAAERDERVRAHLAKALNNAWPIVPLTVAAVEPSSWMRLTLPNRSEINMSGGADAAALRAAADAIRASTAHGRVIAMLNIKGGVGKTVLAANIFAVAHLLSQTRVCFIDLDPQANLSQYFLSPVERHALRQINQTVYSAFTPRGPSSLPLEAFSRLPTALNRKLGPGHFDLVAGDERLFEYTLDLRSLPEKDQSFVRFHALIAELRPRYDVLVIDTNPCATFLTRCAVTSVDHIVAPVKPERYSLTGLNMLEQIARHIRERPVLSREFTTVLNGMGDRFRPRAGGDPDLLAREEIQQAPFFGATLAETGVPFSSLLRAAPSHRYTTNPINQVALLRGAQRPLRESLVAVAQTILMRAGAL